MNVTEKRAAVEKPDRDDPREAESMIVTDYRGLSVGQLADVRNQSCGRPGRKPDRGQEHVGQDRRRPGRQA